MVTIRWDKVSTQGWLLDIPGVGTGLPLDEVEGVDPDLAHAKRASLTKIIQMAEHAAPLLGAHGHFKVSVER